MIAVDTNLLVYSHRTLTPEHRASRKAIERASRDPRGWGFALASVAELWSVVTHPEAQGRPSTGHEVLAFVQSLVSLGHATIWSPGTGFTERLMHLAAELEVSGARIFDLLIALTAFQNGAVELWTHDRAFVALPGLKVVDPLQ